MCNTPGLSRICKESYNDPAEVYARCKQLGMSVVTITDHDSIEAAEVLRKHPDFFISEEVTVRMPTGTEMHLGAYGITEKDHAEIQRRRSDFIALLMYLTERKIFFSVNHVFSGLTGRREAEDFAWFASYVPAFEVRNGQMWTEANRSAKRLAERLGKAGIAGSDSHTLTGVAQTFTEVPGARTVDEFLTGLRAGRGVVHGENGNYLKLTARHFSVRQEPVEGETLGRGDVATDGLCACHYRRALDERNPFLQAVDAAPRRRSKAAENVVGIGSPQWRPTGQVEVAPWPWPKTSGATSRIAITA